VTFVTSVTKGAGPYSVRYVQGELKWGLAGVRLFIHENDGWPRKDKDVLKRMNGREGRPAAGRDCVLAEVRVTGKVNELLEG
jgi:hypothetical protein